MRAQGFRPYLRVLTSSVLPVHLHKTYDRRSMGGRGAMTFARELAAGITKTCLPHLIGSDTTIDDIPEEAPLDVRPTWRMHDYTVLEFSTIGDYSRAKSALARAMIRVADSKTPVLTQAVLQARINSADIVRCRNFSLVDINEQVSHCQIEVTATFSDLEGGSTGETFPKVVMAYDGEMFSHSGMMCQVAKGDPTFCLSAVYGLTTRMQKQDELCKIIYYVGSVDVPQSFLDNPRNRVRCFTDAAELFEAFRNDLIANDPDVLTGWNNYGFDNPYLVQEYMSLTGTIDDRLDEREMETLVALAKEMFPDETRFLAPPTRVINLLRRRREPLPKKEFMKLSREFGEKFVVALRKGKPLPLPVALAMKRVLGDENWRASVPSMVRQALGPQKWAQVTERMDPGSRDALRLADGLGSGSNRLGLRLSRIRGDTCREGHKRMRSAAKGDNYYSFFRSTMSNSRGLIGRCQVDMMQMVKDRDQPASNALKHAAEIYLKEDESMRKQDMDYHEMFAMYAKGSPQDAWRIVEYCWYDSAVCIWVGTARGYWTTVLQEARVTQTRIDDIYNGGQQIKVYSALAHICSGGEVVASMRAQPEHAQPLPECGFAINFWEDTEWPVSARPQTRDDAVMLLDEDEDEVRGAPDYKGAVVLDPRPAFYQDPVVSLDFASLYPSIIRSDNLCYSTIFLRATDALRLGKRKDVAVVVASETSTEEMNRLLRTFRVVISRYTITHTIDGKEFDRNYYVDQSRVGVLPRILNHLHAWRKDEKRLKKEARTRDAKELHDKRQLGIKLVMNSLYGFLGVSKDKGMMPCKPLAAIVTCVGRAMIETTKNGAESLCEGAFVVYGDTDSVMVRLPRDRFSTLGQVWAEGDRLAGIISKVFRPPHDLEMEEIKWPFLLTNKKKTYAARAWEPARGGGYAPHVLIKGLDPVRKDRVKISRDLVTSVLNSLLGSGTNVEPADTVPSAVGTDAEHRAAMEVAKVLDDIVRGSVPLESFVLSRSTRSTYKDRESNVAPMVRDRMIERGDADVPPVGARIAYVITTRGGSKAKQAVAAESPAWFAHNKDKEGLKLNYKYYIGLLKNPLEKILQYTSIPVPALLDIACNSVTTRNSVSVLGKRSDYPTQDFVQSLAKRLRQKKPSEATRKRRRLVVGRRRR